MNTKLCSKCGACWMEGQHYWSGTGKLGNETELASLVCDMVKSDECINPAKGTTKGDGWAKRFEALESFERDMEKLKDYE